jgi:hypothetical protein
VSTSGFPPPIRIPNSSFWTSRNTHRQGWTVTETYQDVISGAKASRPGLNRLMEDARARKFEILLVWKLDRFGRSLVDCLNNIQELERLRVLFIAVIAGQFGPSLGVSVKLARWRLTGVITPV